MAYTLSKLDCKLGKVEWIRSRGKKHPNQCLHCILWQWVPLVNSEIVILFFCLSLTFSAKWPKFCMREFFCFFAVPVSVGSQLLLRHFFFLRVKTSNHLNLFLIGKVLQPNNHLIANYIFPVLMYILSACIGAGGKVTGFFLWLHWPLTVCTLKTCATSGIL